MLSRKNCITDTVSFLTMKAINLQYKCKIPESPDHLQNLYRETFPPKMKPNVLKVSQKGQLLQVYKNIWHLTVRRLYACKPFDLGFGLFDLDLSRHQYFHEKQFSSSQDILVRESSICGRVLNHLKYNL